MREIKFRAWDGQIMFEPRVNEEGHLNAWFNEMTPLWHLMQFTGLKDKNGKEIYEGDILMFPDTESEYVDNGIGMQKVAETPLNAFFSVEFKDGQFGMNVVETEHGIDGWISLKDFFADYFPGNKCEVIGNVWENPDLLKTNEKLK